MKKLSVVLVTAGLLMAMSSQAEAKGCLKGAAVGGVAGMLNITVSLGPQQAALLDIIWPKRNRKKRPVNSKGNSSRAVNFSRIFCTLSKRVQLLFAQACKRQIPVTVNALLCWLSSQADSQLNKLAATFTDSPRIARLKIKEITDCNKAILRISVVPVATSAVWDATAMVKEK